jgi:hypothetical protein
MIPVHVTGTGENEIAAVRDLAARLRGERSEDPRKLEEVRARLRLTWYQGGEEWAPPRAAFRASLIAALRLTGGNQSRLNRMLGLRGDATTISWLSGSSVPSLDMALRLAAATGADLSSILVGDPTFDVRQRAQPPTSKGHRRLDWPAIGRRLDRELHRSEPRSLAVLAHDLALYDDEIKEHFPELAQRLIDRQTAARRERTEQRRIRLVATVEGIVLDLVAAGIYPSRREVEARLPPGASLREPLLHEAWRRAPKDPKVAPARNRSRRLIGSDAKQQ